MNICTQYSSLSLSFIDISIINKRSASLNSIPYEIFLIIFDFANLTTLYTLKNTNRSFKQLFSRLLSQKIFFRLLKKPYFYVPVLLHGNLNIVQAVEANPKMTDQEFIKLWKNYKSKYDQQQAVNFFLENSTPSTDDDMIMMYWAIENGQKEILKIFVKNLRINLPHAVRATVFYGQKEILRFLLQDPRVDPSADDNQAIRNASLFGHTKIVSILLQDRQVDPCANDNEAIRNASSSGHIEIVSLLLQDPRVDPSADDNQAIRNASLFGHTKIVSVLLQDPRVDPCANDNEAIRNASSYDHIEIVSLLLKDPRVDPSANNNEAIRKAIKRGHKETLSLLLQATRVNSSTKNYNYTCIIV